MGFDSGMWVSNMRGRRGSWAPGFYRVIYADPPWRFKVWSAKGRGRSADRHYRTMQLDELRELPVARLAARDCLLLMWAVDPLLPEALELGRAWGFTYKTVGFYWAKTDRDGNKLPIGTGYWTRANPEQCLLFTRGAPDRLSKGVPKLIVAPRREHSRKPDEARTRIRKLAPGPYLELFAREAAKGWDAWGHEPMKFRSAAA